MQRRGAGCEGWQCIDCGALCGTCAVYPHCFSFRCCQAGSPILLVIGDSSRMDDRWCADSLSECGSGCVASVGNLGPEQSHAEALAPDGGGEFIRRDHNDCDVRGGRDDGAGWSSHRIPDGFALLDSWAQESIKLARPNDVIVPRLLPPYTPKVYESHLSGRIARLSGTEPWIRKRWATDR